MKKSIHNALLGILGTSMGMYMMVVPLTTAYASEQQVPFTYNSTGKNDLQSLLNQITPNTKINNEIQDPVTAVKASADKVGFDAKLDSFSLVSKTETSAVVKVIHNKTNYNVTLRNSRQDHSQWVITSVKKFSETSNTAPIKDSGTVSTGSSSAGSTTSTSAGSSNTASAEQQAVDLLNADRRANGLSNLQVDARLTAVALNHAQDMINRNFFSHNNPDGQTPFDRMKKAGISYSAAGENIAKNQSVQAAEVAFMNSSGHRANILNSSYNTVGIGVAYDKTGNVYVVQDFIKS
ncbi:MAG: SCP-like extracellular [Firmicutes bacterium]|nr:SCP-like extracellular [Bacillota bacterium]